MNAEPSTPLMRQYQAVKQQVNGALLLFRLGDFYELFYDDAVTAARELEITLTSRNKEKGEPIPMCGVPYHSADGYIARLIQKGYRVAICDQMEEAGPGKKLVRRELSRVVTPGTATDASLLRSHENNYLGSGIHEGRPLRTGLRRCLNGRLPHDRASERRTHSHAGNSKRSRGRSSGGPSGRRAVSRNGDPILGVRAGLRRTTNSRTFQAVVARWLRPGRQAAGDCRGRRSPALPAGHATLRARSSEPAVVLRADAITWCWTRPRFAIWS